MILIIGGDSGESTVPYQGMHTRDPLEFIISDQRSSDAVHADEASESVISTYSHMGQMVRRD